METNICWVVFGTFLALSPVESRIHKLHLTNTEGPVVPLSAFGLLKDGSISVSLESLSLGPGVKLTSTNYIGFTISRSIKPEAELFGLVGTDDTRCALSDAAQRPLGPHVEVVLDLANECVRIRRSADMPDVKAFGSNSDGFAKNDSTVVVHSRKPRNVDEDYSDETLRDTEDEQISPWRRHYFQWPGPSKTTQLQHHRANPAGVRSRSYRKKQQQMIEALIPVAVSNDTSEAITQLSSTVITQPHTSTPSNAVTNGSLASTAMPWTSLKGSCSSDASNQEVPLAVKRETDGTTISTTFTLQVTSEDMEGMYYVRFHNCLHKNVSFDIDVLVTEKNGENNYLSAGEMPLPFIYFAAAASFFIGGIIWMCLLCYKGVVVYKLHYLMAALAYTKCLVLMFHAEDYRIVQTDGAGPTNFKISVILTVLREASFVMTVILATSGYYMMRHLISCKQMLILFLVGSAQIATHVVRLAMNGPEEIQNMDQNHSIFFSVDLVSYAALLFPVIWSLHALRGGKKKDSDRKKLRSFCHICSFIILYVYFTRIFVNLVIKSSVPFKYTWICEVLREAASFILFALTAFWLRPAPSDLYARLKLFVPEDNKDSNREENKFRRMNELPAWSKKPGQNIMKAGVFRLDSESESDDDNDEQVLLDRAFYLSGGNKKRMM